MIIFRTTNPPKEVFFYFTVQVMPDEEEVQLAWASFFVELGYVTWLTVLPEESVQVQVLSFLQADKSNTIAIEANKVFIVY